MATKVEAPRPAPVLMRATKVYDMAGCDRLGPFAANFYYDRDGNLATVTLERGKDGISLTPKDIAELAALAAAKGRTE